MRATSFCQRHIDDGHPRFVRRSEGVAPCGVPRMRGAFSRRPTRFGCSGSAFRLGRVLPVASTGLAPSDAPVTARRLPLRLRERRPPSLERRCLRARGRDHLFVPSRDGRHASGDPERLPSAGRRSRRRGGAPTAFRFRAQRRSPGLRASTTMTPFVRFLPQRYDREHDPEKGRFLAAPADRAGARPGPRRRIAVSPRAVRAVR